MMKFQAQADQLYVSWQVFVPQQWENKHMHRNISN